MDRMKRIRSKIDSIDRHIIKLIEERSLLAKKIGNHKKKNNLCLVDKKREKEVLNNIKKEAIHLGLSSGVIVGIFKKIIIECRNNEK